MLQEDVYWRQRAKKHWYKDGDKNTKFFHASASARKKANRILSLVDDNGVKVTSIDDLCYVAKNYFSNIFAPKHSCLASVVETIRRTVTDDDNLLLTSPFTNVRALMAIIQASINISGLFAAMIYSKIVAIGLILASFLQLLALQI
jgi:hypothetical protein